MFKIGDKVICIDNRGLGDLLDVTKEYVVEEFYTNSAKQNFISIFVRGSKYSFKAERFILSHDKSIIQPNCKYRIKIKDMEMYYYIYNKLKEAGYEWTSCPMDDPEITVGNYLYTNSYGYNDITWGTHILDGYQVINVEPTTTYKISIEEEMVNIMGTEYPKSVVLKALKNI